MGNASVESRMNAVAQAQATVLIHLGTWLRDPSKDNRVRLDQSMAECEDVLDRLLCPFRLTKRDLAEQR